MIVGSTRPDLDKAVREIESQCCLVRRYAFKLISNRHPSRQSRQKRLTNTAPDVARIDMQMVNEVGRRPNRDEACRTIVMLRNQYGFAFRLAVEIIEREIRWRSPMKSCTSRPEKQITEDGKVASFGGPDGKVHSYL